MTEPSHSVKEILAQQRISLSPCMSYPESGNDRMQSNRDLDGVRILRAKLGRPAHNVGIYYVPPRKVCRSPLSLIGSKRWYFICQTSRSELISTAPLNARGTRLMSLKRRHRFDVMVPMSLLWEIKQEGVYHAGLDHVQVASFCCHWRRRTRRTSSARQGYLDGVHWPGVRVQ